VWSRILFWFFFDGALTYADIDHGPSNGVAAPTGGDCRHSGLDTNEAYL